MNNIYTSWIPNPLNDLRICFSDKLVSVIVSEGFIDLGDDGSLTSKRAGAR